MANKVVPVEAVNVLSNIKEILGSAVAGVYLYGSAVVGGLRNNSDVDIMVVVNHRLPESARRKLLDRLLLISGKSENGDSARRLEVTVINHDEVVPWKYPPRKEFLYGEWLRNKFEQGQIPEPTYDPDLAILLSQIRFGSIALAGRAASEILDPVPMEDVHKAMEDCLPSLIGWLKGDERNVILTLARMWATAVEGIFLPKDKAAEWAIPRLPKEQAALLELAGKAYRGEYADKWDGLDFEVEKLANHMKKEIELCIDSPDIMR